MYFKILLNYLIGYLNITVEGYFIERFLNMCLSENIILWNSKRIKSTKFNTNIGISDFKRIKYILKKTKCKVKINHKKGFPFLFNRYKKRKIFAICLALVLILLFTLSRFVWNIEVRGNETIEEEQILQIVEKSNIKIGILKSKLDFKKAAENIRLERSDVAWVGIELQGTNVKINIVESIPKPKIINENEYCNIVATKDAIIEKVNAQKGIPVVQKESVVKKGDLLISGTIEGQYTKKRKVHAIGTVYGRTCYSQKEKIYFKEQKKEATGRFENKYSVNINNFKINFNKGVSKLKNYDTIETKKRIRIFSDFYLPIEIIKTTYNEIKSYDITYTEKEAESIGISKAKEKLDQLIIDKDSIVDVRINTEYTSEFIEVEVIYEVIESIGTEEKIKN